MANLKDEDEDEDEAREIPGCRVSQELPLRILKWHLELVLDLCSQISQKN